MTAPDIAIRVLILAAYIAAVAWALACFPWQRGQR